MLVNQKVTFETICGCGAKHHSVVDLPVEIPNEALEFHGQIEHAVGPWIPSALDEKPREEVPGSNYVVGIVTNGTESKSQIALIRKQRPAWQCGRLNGPGGMLSTLPGEVPSDEAFKDAMVQTFKRETGVITDPGIWAETVRLISDPDDGNYRVSFYRTILSPNHFKEITSPPGREPVEIFYIEDLWYGGHNLVEPLRAVMALTLENHVQRPAILRTR